MLTQNVTIFARTTTGQFVNDPPVEEGDFQISLDGGEFENLDNLPTVTAGSAAIEITLSNDERAAGHAVIRGIDQTATKEWTDNYTTVDTESVDVGFKITPSTLKAGPLNGQRLVFTSSVGGRSVPGHVAELLNIRGIIKADGSIENIAEDLEFVVEESELFGVSYYVLNFDSELENVDTEEPISLEPGDSMLASVEYRFNGELLGQLLTFPILEPIAEATSMAILANPNVPLANNAQGQVEASNVSVQVAGGGSAHTPQEVVDALLQFVINSQVWPVGTFARAVQDANKFGQSRVIDTTDPDNTSERTFDEQPISE